MNFILVLLIAISSVSANSGFSHPLMCWQCRSLEGEFCDDPFDPKTYSDKEHLRECPLDMQFGGGSNPSQGYGSSPGFNNGFDRSQSVCVKTVEMDSHGNKRVSRLCGKENVISRKGHCDTIDQFGDTKYCVTCHTDGCNHGINLNAPAILTILSVMTSIAMISFQNRIN